MKVGQQTEREDTIHATEEPIKNEQNLETIKEAIVTHRESKRYKSEKTSLKKSWQKRIFISADQWTCDKKESNN